MELLFSDADSDLRNVRWHISRGYAKNCRLGLAHRVVLARICGAIPSGLVSDHINRNRLDNRRENLRAVDNSENARNSDYCDNARRYFRRKDTGKWQVQCYRYGRKIYFGTAYETEQEAASVAARLAGPCALLK